MSSRASGADHIDRVRSQLPYALTVEAVSIQKGTFWSPLKPIPDFAYDISGSAARSYHDFREVGEGFELITQIKNK